MSSDIAKPLSAPEETSCADALLEQAEAALSGTEQCVIEPQPLCLKEFTTTILNVQNNEQNNEPRSCLTVSSEMDLRVAIGQTCLNLASIIELRRGSVVQLDNPVSAPVELYANEQLVARGDLVVLDDKIGVRVNELVADSQETTEAP